MKKLVLIGGLALASTSFSQTGINWGTPGDVAGSSFGNNYPRVVMDGSGNPMVTWSNGDVLLFSRWTGSSFSVPDTLSAPGVIIANGTWMGPDLASHGDTVYAVYKETPEADANSGVYCVRSFDGGQTFMSPVQVNTFTADSITRFPTITTNDNGHPIVAFMEFDPGFGDARWMVATSSDYGATYGADVKASGWSSGTSEVCDCCPGFITSSGSTVAMVYRDNDSDVRDTWVGISTDGGSSFIAGMDVDQQGWIINSCPSSGPDGFMIGDSIYTTYMSGESGTNKVSYNSSNHSTVTGTPAIPLNANGPAAVQNYPRTANSGLNAGYVWRENVTGPSMALFKFSSDITSGLPAEIDTVSDSGVTSADIALSSTQVIVIWQDFNTGTVRYRFGTFPGVGIEENPILNVEVYPNPTVELWQIQGDLEIGEYYTITDLNGRLVESGTVSNPNWIEIDASQLSPGTYIFSTSAGSIRLIKK